MARYRRDTLHGTDMDTVYRGGAQVRSLMLEVVMSHERMTYDEAKVLLDTKVRFHFWSSKSGTSMVRSGKKLRAAIPHWMSELKKLAAAAFYTKYNSLHDKNEVGSIVYDKKGNRSSRLFPATCLQCLWDDNFLQTGNGKSSMKAALEAVYGKWGDVADLVVPSSPTNREKYYKVTALLYSLLALKVSACSAAHLCFVKLMSPCVSCMSLDAPHSHLILTHVTATALAYFAPRLLYHPADMQVRTQLRHDAGLPPVITRGHHIDEGHRKQWASQLYFAHTFLHGHSRVQDVLLLLDAGQGRFVKGFSKRSLRAINREWRLKNAPTFNSPSGATPRPTAVPAAGCQGGSRMMPPSGSPAAPAAADVRGDQEV